MIGLPTWWRLAAGAALLATAAGAGWTARGWRADAAVAQLQRGHAEALAAAERRAAAQHQAASETADRLARLAQETTDALAAAQAQLDRSRAALDGTRGRLLDAWTRSASASRCPDPHDPAAVAAAGAAELVRADVFRGATARAVELAGSADQLHAYATACASRYRQVDEQLRALRAAGTAAR